MGRYFSVKFWFISGEITFKTAVIMLCFFGLMIIAGIVLKSILKAKKQSFDHLLKGIINRITTLLFYMGAIGLMITFFMYEGANFVSYKFWFLVWCAVTLYWAVIIVKAALKIPLKRSEIEKRKNYEKYLPKKK